MVAVTGPIGVFVGLTTVDLIHRVAHAPGANEKLTALRRDLAAGGPAANAAVTFSALGGRAILITALGRGAVADVARSDLQSHGVEVADFAPASESLAISAVTVVDSTGDRSVVSMDANAAAAELSSVIAGSGDFASVLSGQLSRADVLLIDGHYPQVAAAACVAAQSRGLRAVLDAGRWKPQFQILLPLVSDVVCSADFRLPGVDPERTAITILGMGASAVAITHGGDPIEWWTPEASGSVAVPQVRAVDTLGAGDVFHGAYAFFSTDASLDVPQRLARAAQVAAVRTSVAGPRSWLSALAGSRSHLPPENRHRNDHYSPHS